MKRLNLNLLLVVVLGLSIFVFSTFERPISDSYAQTQTKTHVNFPEDHNPHPGFDAEWWYLNMNLRVIDDSGAIKHIDSLISLSRVLGNDGLLVSMYERQSGTFDEKTSVGNTDVSQIPLGTVLRFDSQDSNGEIAPIDAKSNDGKLQVTFSVKGSSSVIDRFDLVLVANDFNNPLLWGCTGNISVFRPNDTYYYSVPLIEVNGNIEIDGKSYVITKGTAWMDHQWFSGSPPSSWDGHYWFSGSNGRNRAVGFVTQLYDEGPKNTYWVMRRNGVNYCGAPGTTKVTVHSKWDNGYPKQMSFNTDQGRLRVNTRSDNQIFDPPAGPNFYEPSILRIRGVLGGGLTGLLTNGFFETHLKN